MALDSILYTTRHNTHKSRAMGYTRTLFVAAVVVAAASTTKAFQCDSIVNFPSPSSRHDSYTRHSTSRLCAIPGQGYDPNSGNTNNSNNKERRNPFIPPINGDAAKQKKPPAYQNPYTYSPPPKKRTLAVPWSNTQSSSRQQQKQPWSSSYVPTAPPSVSSNAGDLKENLDYLRQQSQEAALAANELLERNRQDLLRRSQEASERAESFLISSREAAVRAARARQERHFTETTRFIATPFLAAALSFFLYPTTSRCFHSIAQFCSQNNWVPVDGGNLQWSVLLPALNGVVMTAVSLLYANLISTTGTALRNRQIKIQESLRTEVR